MNIKLIARYVGVALLFNALFMFISLIVSIVDGFDAAFSPLLLSTLITAMVGSFPLIFVRKSSDISIRDGFAITLFSWFLSSFFGMLPYVMYGGEFTLINAWFESVSGYTTTGGTILTDVEALPKSLLFWRSSTHFIGGTGVVVFMLLVLPALSTFRLKLSKIEISSISNDTYRKRSSEVLQIIMVTYLGIALAAAVSLFLAGMTLFDAINHAMSIAATGGFSTRNLSVLHYDSPVIETVCIVFMYISSIHFGMIYAAIVKRSKMLFKSPVVRYFIIISILLSLAVATDLRINETFPTYGESMRHAFFQVASFISTTGLASAEISSFPVFSLFIMLLVFIHGGCSGSTSGGIKADRVVIFYKVVRAQIVKLMHPKAVVPIKVGDHHLDSHLVETSILFIALYGAISIVGMLLLAVSGLDFVESFSASISSMSNIGPCLAAGHGSLGNFGDFPSFAKFVMTVIMFFGRLEIYSLLMVFYIFKKN